MEDRPVGIGEIPMPADTASPVAAAAAPPSEARGDEAPVTPMDDVELSALAAAAAVMDRTQSEYEALEAAVAVENARAAVAGAHDAARAAANAAAAIRAPPPMGLFAVPNEARLGSRRTDTDSEDSASWARPPPEPHPTSAQWIPLPNMKGHGLSASGSGRTDIIMDPIRMTPGLSDYGPLPSEHNTMFETERESDEVLEPLGRGGTNGVLQTAVPWRERMRQLLLEWLSSLQLSLGYLYSDMRKHKRSLGIGVCTVFLVVCFLSLIQNALQRSSVVFIKLAEEQVGQYDLVFTPAVTNMSTSFFLNYTFMNMSLTNAESITGSAPRWVVPCQMLHTPSPSAVASGSSQSGGGSFSGSTAHGSIGSGVDILSPATQNASVILLAINTTLESSIGLGTSWTHRPLGKNELHVTSSTLRALGAKPNAGQRVLVQINVLSVLQQFSGSSGQTPSDMLVNFLDGLEYNFTDATIPIPVGLLPNNTAGLNGTSGPNNVTTVPLVDLIDAVNQAINGTSNADAIAYLVKVIVKNNDLLVYTQEFTVIDGIDDPSGKYPPSLGNVAVIEEEWFQYSLRSFVASLLSQPFVSALAGPQMTKALKNLETLDINSYALMVIAMFKDRVDIYTQDSAPQQLALIRASDSAASALGLNFSATWTFPVAFAVQASETIKLFLNQIFFAVNGVLVILAVLLIYSLLLSDVEEKTFEYGMLRTLGMRHSVLVLLLIMQSVVFSTPGIVLGFLCCYILYVYMDVFVSMFVVIPINPALSSSAVTIGLVLGILLPVVGMVLPIRRALTQTLRDALDVYHNMANNSIVTIRRLEDLGVSLTETVVAITLVVIGFLVYYLAPLAFIYNNLEMFLNILTVILLGMVVGEVLIAQVFDIYLEKIILFLIMWGPDRLLRRVVNKSLHAHRSRNRKTGMMFTLCTGFVIFAATMFVQQANSIPENLEWAAGADIVVQSPSITYPLPRANISRMLDQFVIGAPTSANLKQFQVVQGYTFISFPATSTPLIGYSGVSGIATIRGRRIVLQAVDENFLDVAATQFYILGQIASDVQFPYVPGTTIVDAVAPLNETLGFSNARGISGHLVGYVPPVVLVPYPIDPNAANETRELQADSAELYGSYFPVLMSASMQGGIYCDTTTPMQLYVRVQERGQMVYNYYLLKPVALLKKFPGFLNINQLTTTGSAVIVSMKTMAKVLQDAYATFDDVTPSLNYSEPPLQSLLIRIDPSASLEQIEGVVNSINSLLSDIPNIGLVNVRFQIAQTSLATQIIMLFFDVVAVVGVIFCFFVLWLSFTANVRENSWEFGVLRAIGLDSGTVMRLYIYEAMALVLACITLGTILGIITAVLLTLQLDLFSQDPFSLTFPIALYVLIVVLSLFVAALGSYVPAAELKKKEVAIALKGA